MADTSELRALLRQHLADARNGWSIGALGALAEFHRTESEPAHVDTHALTVSTERGALRVSPHPDTLPLAYEAPVSNADRWQHGVVFCLPQKAARRAARRVFTDVGPDPGPIRERDHEARLFDLGLEAANVDACIRTSDAETMAALEPHLGRPLLEPGNPAVDAVKANNPHRVFVSALGRIEVYQSIPGADAVSPEGPHTHVLPGLLASGRTHSPEIPVPPGYLPCLHLHPPGPFRHSKGGMCFESDAYRSFQALIERWGDARYRRARDRVMSSVRAGCAPNTGDLPQAAIDLLGLRVGLRQIRHLDGPSECLDRWRAAFED